MYHYLRGVSLRTRITVSFVLIVLCGTAISTYIGSRIITRAMLNQALKQVRHGLDVAQIEYEARLDDVRRSVENAAGTVRPEAAVEHGNQRLAELLLELQKRNGLDFLGYVDAAQGVVLSSSGNVRSMTDAGFQYSDLVRGALAGNSAADTRLLDRGALEQESRTLADRAHMLSVDGFASGSAPDVDVSSGMVLIASAPVQGAAKPKGAVYGGILLNRNRGIVDQINRLVFGGERSGGREIGSVSIFMGDVRVATTVAQDAATRAEGTRVAPEADQAVLKRGQHWYGRDRVGDGWLLTAYEPIRSRSGAILGILYVGIQELPFLAVRTDMMLTFLIVAALGVLVVLGLTYLITRSMIHPLEEIVVASDRIAAGDLDHAVNVSARDEIGLLASSFNKMVASLRTMRLELEEWGRTLEEKVKKRTEELATVQNQMAQSEKLASIGRLAAGVAHEINNPLGGILTFSSLALEECDERNPLRQNLEIVVKQTLRCRETVKGLLDFARQTTAAETPTEINPVIERTLSLLENQPIFHNVKIVLNLKARLPRALIDPGQLQQVVVNIALNAVDAMEESGTLTVETSLDSPAQELLLRISDTGKGIPEQILPLIFEPFFTTKKVGKGTGLGLSIVHGIVTRAGGRIEVSSSLQGASFAIRLPVVREEAGRGNLEQPEQRVGGKG